MDNSKIVKGVYGEDFTRLFKLFFKEVDRLGVGSINGQIKIRRMKAVTMTPMANPTQSKIENLSLLTVFPLAFRVLYPVFGIHRGVLRQ